MISAILSLLIVFWGWSGLRRAQWRFVFAAICLLTSMFDLNIPSPLIKYFDFYILLIAFPLIFYVKWGKVISGFRNDSVGKVVFWINIYILFTFLWTAFSGSESFGYSVKVFRTYLFFWSYFYLKEIRYDQYVKAFKVLFYVSIVLGIFFLLQIVDINLLRGGTEYAFSKEEIARMRNIPITTVLVIFSLLFLKIKTGYKVMLTLMWVGILVLSQHRGMILSLCVAIPLLFWIRGSLRKIFKIAVLGGVLILLFSPVLMQRFGKESNELSLTEEIKKGLAFSSLTLEDAHDGTFLFRTFLIKERVEYMLDHPVNFIFGLGMRHEDSPLTSRKFHFQLGTAKLNGTSIQTAQIQTNDVALLSDFMRAGILYIILFAIFCYKLYVIFMRNVNNASNLGFLLLTFCLLRILSGDEFNAFNYSCLFIFAICARDITQRNLLYEKCDSGSGNFQSIELPKKSIV